MGRPTDVVPQRLYSKAKLHLLDHAFLPLLVLGVLPDHFRINAYRALDLQNLAIRYIPLEIPKLETLNLPAKIPEIALSKRGLVLVTGVTGSGKSTSLAAMLRHINENMRSKIITLEDPVEFLHEEQLCSISQREVGIDTDDYSTGLKQVFRQIKVTAR